MTTLLDRQPPRSLEAELGVLGSILLLPAVCDDVAGIVRPDDFYNAINAKLYGHLLAMHSDGGRIDSVLVAERLILAGDYEMVGGSTYLAKLGNDVVTPAYAKHYAEIVREKSRLRSLIGIGTEILSDAYGESLNADELCNQVRVDLDRIAEGASAGTVITASDAAAAAIQRAAELAGGQGAGGLATGLPVVDEAIGGMFPGELVILAARPGDGKTSNALQIATRHGLKGRTVLFISTEMSAGELMLRAACTKSGVSGNELRNGRVTPVDIEQIRVAAEDLGKSSLLIDDRPRLSVADIRNVCRRLHRESRLSLVIVDYLQRLQPADARRPRHEQVGQLAADLKTVARELSVPVLALCQLNRATGNAPDGRPGLANLRESGSIESEADQVWILFRPETAKPEDADLKGKAEFIVAKNRNGATGKFDLYWDAASTSFTDATSREWNPNWEQCIDHNYDPFNDE